MSTTDPTTTAALARVDVDASHALYTTADGARLARDVDIAAWCGLAQPRDIRRTIAAAIADGAILSAGAAPAATSAGPVAFGVEEQVPRGARGAMQSITTFYLNEAAGLLLATRLRTERAIRLTREIVTVFAAVRRGQVPAVAAPPPAPADRLDALLATVDRLCGVVAQLVGTVASHALAAPPRLPAPATATEAPAPTAPLAPQPEPAVEEPAPEEGGTVIPASWVSATTLAARASARLQKHIAANSIGRAVSALKIRERGIAVARCETLQKQVREDYAIDVAAWRYEPGILAEIVDYLRTQGPGPRKAAPRAGYASSARGVVDALTDADRGATTPRPRPQSTHA